MNQQPQKRVGVRITSNPDAILYIQAGSQPAPNPAHRPLCRLLVSDLAPQAEAHSIGSLSIYKTPSGAMSLAAMLPQTNRRALAETGFTILAGQPNQDAVYVAYAPAVHHAMPYGG